MIDLSRWYRKFFSPFMILNDPRIDIAMLPTIALSVMPPWSHLFFHPGEGAKDIENRNWPYPPKHRGPIFIHASGTFDGEGYIKVQAMFPDIRMPKKDDFQHGGIIGMVDLIDVVSSHPSRWYAKGQNTAFVVRNPIPLPFYQCKGKLNLWDATEATEHYKEILK